MRLINMYPVPLSESDRQELFEMWCAANEEALAEIEATACKIAARGGKVSSKYLVEKQRYEGTAPLQSVPFQDVYGNVHDYKVNNTDTPLLARYLKAKYPTMKIELRRRQNETL